MPCCLLHIDVYKRQAFYSTFDIKLIGECCDVMKAIGAGHNMVDVKKINRGLILYLIYQNKGLSRKALAAKTGLTPAAITLIIGDMLREGLLVETQDVYKRQPADNGRLDDTARPRFESRGCRFPLTPPRRRKRPWPGFSPSAPSAWRFPDP